MIVGRTKIEPRINHACVSPPPLVFSPPPSPCPALPWPPRPLGRAASYALHARAPRPRGPPSSQPWPTSL